MLALLSALALKHGVSGGVDVHLCLMTNESNAEDSEELNEMFAALSMNGNALTRKWRRVRATLPASLD